MADTLTKLINSPPGVLVAGGVLAGIVWRFFERVEAVLTDQTKLEIAVWLVGRKKFGPKVQPWPDTFAEIFDRVFGRKHLSWKCLRRSAIASILITIVMFVYSLLHFGVRCLNLSGVQWPDTKPILMTSLLACIIPPYLSLLETRLILRVMKRTSHSLTWVLLLIIDLIITGYTSVVFVYVAVVLAKGADDLGGTIISLPFKIAQHPIDLAWILVAPKATASFLFIPCLFTSIWLWLYAGSGFLLKAARRFDLGFDWFNRKFDIEKKPLQSIGMVAGALVAVVYWTAVIVARGL